MSSNSKTDFAKRIDQAGTSEECERIQQEMDVLSKHLCTQSKQLKQHEQEIGFHYEGNDRFECACGNCVDPFQKYMGTCHKCFRDSCVGCLGDCGVCGQQHICCYGGDNDEHKACLTMCVGCEDCFVCPECVTNCDQCGEPLCDDCTEPLIDDVYCPECYDYHNM